MFIGDVLQHTIQALRCFFLRLDDGILLVVTSIVTKIDISVTLNRMKGPFTDCALTIKQLFNSQSDRVIFYLLR